MSIKVMSQVWQEAPETGSDLLVLLALADYSNDEGKSIYPSIKTLAHKARLSTRQTQRVMRKLQESGKLKIVEAGGFAGGRNLSNQYHLVLDKICVTHDGGGDIGDRGVVTPMSPDPSYKPSLNENVLSQKISDKTSSDFDDDEVPFSFSKEDNAFHAETTENPPVSGGPPLWYNAIAQQGGCILWNANVKFTESTRTGGTKGARAGFVASATRNRGEIDALPVMSQVYLRSLVMLLRRSTLQQSGREKPISVSFELSVAVNGSDLMELGGIFSKESNFSIQFLANQETILDGSVLFVDSGMNTPHFLTLTGSFLGVREESTFQAICNSSAPTATSAEPRELTPGDTKPPSPHVALMLAVSQVLLGHNAHKLWTADQAALFGKTSKKFRENGITEVDLLAWYENVWRPSFFGLKGSSPSYAQMMAGIGAYMAAKQTKVGGYFLAADDYADDEERFS